MNFHSNLKLLYETSSCTVNFLDLNVSLRNGEMHTDLYIKPTYGHQYLLILRPQYHIEKH